MPGECLNPKNKKRPNNKNESCFLSVTVALILILGIISCKFEVFPNQAKSLNSDSGEDIENKIPTDLENFKPNQSPFDYSSNSTETN